MKKDQKNTARPYMRLLRELEEIINNTSPNDKLPPEPQLAEKLDVSRATLREAMRTFEVQGMIRRRQGMGTFVVGPIAQIEAGLEMLESIESRAKKISLEVSMGDLVINPIDANEIVAASLSVPQGESILEVKRVILTENRPIAYLVDYLPKSLLTPDELDQGFTGSVLDLLIKRGKPTLSHAKTNISAGGASPDIAKALQVQRGDVLLIMTSRLFSEQNEVVDYLHSYFIPGYFNFHVIRRLKGNHPIRVQED